MIHEEIEKHGTGTTDQPCIYFVKEGPVIGRSFGCPGKSIWGVQGTGIPLRRASQKEPGFHPNSGTVSGLYGKIGTKPHQTYKINFIIDGVIDQYSSKNGTGGVFIKTSAWQKKRGKLNDPAHMTGYVSKNSHRFTVSLSQTLNVIIT